MSRGFVIGTGDLSEQALGWSTYNADHMSMYNVNTSVPKRWCDSWYGMPLIISSLVNFPICCTDRGYADQPRTPSPGADGTIRQDTEASVGAYELHDFFLFHFVRNGFDRDKILFCIPRRVLSTLLANGDCRDS